MNLTVGTEWIVDQCDHQVLAVVAEILRSREEEDELLGIITAQQRDNKIRRSVVDNSIVYIVPHIAAQVSGGRCAAISLGIVIPNTGTVADGVVVR